MSLLNTLLGTKPPVSQPTRKLDEKSDTSRVRKLVMEASGYLTLNPQEVASLKSLLSESGGVFVRGSFTTDDAAILGLNFDENSPAQADNDNHEEQQLRNRTQSEYEAGMLPAHLALVAPDLTPGHSSPISTSEAQRVIGVQEPAAPSAPTSEHQQAPSPQQAPAMTAEARALSMFNFGGLGLGSGHQLNEAAQPPQPAPEGEVNILATNLAESRRRRHQQQKKKKHTSGMGHQGPPRSDEEQRLRALSSSKLSQL